MIAKCPSPETLRSYLLGECEDGASDAIEQHLGQCASCEITAAALDSASDSLLRHLPLAAAADPAPQGASPGWLARLRSGPPRATTDRDSWEASLEPLDQRSNYELLGILGRGGMGVVYRCRHRSLHRIVALKVLGPRLLAANEARRRFEREIRILGRLKHPGIVMATDAGRIGAAAYLVMEFVDGADLARLVRRTGPLRVAEACEVASQMAAALAAAHEVGAIHRDVKPSNAMIDREGYVKLLDFGLAYLANTSPDQSETSVGRFLGTLEYMAPEQLEPDAANTMRADLYGLGATLFFLLTGRPPHHTDRQRSVLEQLRTIASASALRVSALRGDVPEQLDELLARLLSRDPNERPATAREVAVQLRAWAGGDLAALVAELPPMPENHAAAEQSLSQLLEPDSAESLKSVPSSAGGAATQPRHPFSGRGRFRQTTMWIAAAGAAAAVIWALIILLQTPEGTLRIESEAADVRVELVDENDVPRQWTVERGENETTLRAGRYRVRLAGAHDGLTLEPDALVIRKGAEVLARVTRTADAEQDAQAAIPAARSNTEPIYQGQPESEWLRRFAAEQAPVAKLQAAEALFSFTAELPFPQRVDRIVEIGGRVVEAGWGENHLVLALSPGRWARNEGARWPFGGDVELKAVFANFWVRLEAEIDQVPEAVLAERLGQAVVNAPVHASSFAACLLAERFSDGQLTEPDAQRIASATLEGLLHDLDRSAVAVLLRAHLTSGAAEAEQADVLDAFHDLAKLLHTRPSDPLQARFRTAWLEVAKHVPASRWAAQLILDEALQLGTSAIQHRFHATWFKSELPYADNWARHARQTTAYFLNDWVSVVNEYLAEEEEETVRPHLPALVLSLDYVTRIYFAEDDWELQRTAELLIPLLRGYYAEADGELKQQAPEELLPVPAADVLKIIARVNGTIPAFVREGRPRSAPVVERLAAFERMMAEGGDLNAFYQQAEQLQGLLQVAPYRTVQIALAHEGFEQVTLTNVFDAVKERAKQPEVDGIPPLDPLLMLAILADLAGENKAQDQRMLYMLPNKFGGSANTALLWRHLYDVLSGPWQMKPVVHRLLQQIADKAAARSLVEAAKNVDPTIETSE